MIPAPYARAAELDVLLGDVADDANPVGRAALLDADERQEMCAAGEDLLDAFGFNAEFVPAAYGGRLRRADHLAEVLRTLWRRDPCLGLGYGFASFIASVNLWTSGDEQQRARAAGLLLGNGRIAAAFHELAHGTDFAHAEFRAQAVDGGWRLSGRKEVVTNLRRAEAMVLFARTAEGPGSRALSQLFVQRDQLPAGRVRDLPRFPSSGMRGVQLGGAQFLDCPVPAQALIGEPGQGMEIALRSYQVTRTLLPAMSVGPLDSALRVAFDHATARRLYGEAVAEIPFVRAVLARAYADLLAVDACSAVVLRALHLLPEAMGVYAPAAKYFAAGLVLEAFDALRTALGSAGYLREGPHALFQKLSRDIAPASFAHVSRAACLVMLLPQLPRLARRSWLAEKPAAAALFEPGADLPPLPFAALSAGSPAADPLLAVLDEAALDEAVLAAAPADPLRRFAGRFRAELVRLREDCLALRPQDLAIDASPRAFDLAARYTVLLAAACALGLGGSAPGPLSEPALLGVLDRLDARLAGPAVLDRTERARLEEQLFREASARHRERRLFDLTARRIPGSRRDHP